MIPNVEKSVQVTSTIDSDDTGQFTVDENALGHIMDVLTNLYSDPEQAVIREYLTNAYDAQVEAGMKPGTPSWKPIEVTTPSHFGTAYSIRDYGIGMSVDDLKNTYSKYGKSTKTKSNDVTGMLGLGSKCGLTYTNSFTITGIKNGVKAKAIISKNEENIPVFHIVDTRSTNEPDGVEISIPVKSRHSFAEKTREFLKFWGEGLVIVDGKVPDRHNHAKIQTSDIEYVVEGKTVKGKVDVYLIEKERYAYNAPQSYVVMGNVPYAVDTAYVDSVLSDNGMGLVAYVPMGAVAFPPNREKLMYTAGTKAVVQTLSKGLFEHILAQKIKAVTDAPDHVDAWAKYQAIPYAFQRTTEYINLTYKGDKFTDKLQHEHFHLHWDHKGNGQLTDKNFVHMPAAIAGSLIITGVDFTRKPTSYFKKKVRQYISDNGLSSTDALLVEKDIDSNWLTHLPRVNADTIKALKLPKLNNGPRVEVGYEYYIKDAGASLGYTCVPDTLNIPTKGKRLVYISPSDMRETYRKSGTNAPNLLKRLPDDTLLVVLGTNRFEKFLRAYPTAEKAAVVIQEVIDNLVNSTTDNEYMVQQLGYNEREFLKKVDSNELNDPDLADLATIVQNDSGNDHYAKALEIKGWAYRASITPTMPERKNVVNKVSKRYPLIEQVGSRKIKHLVYYINAVFEAEYAV